MILHCSDVKDKLTTLRAMASLDRDEFEILCKIFGEVWDEKAGEAEKLHSKGDRNLILKASDDRCFFILFYLKSISVARGVGAPVWDESRVS